MATTLTRSSSSSCASKKRSPRHDFGAVPELGVEVQSAMADVLPSADPLDATDFDAIEFLNDKFPTERSLASLDAYLAEVGSEIGRLDDEISRAVHAQAEAGARASRDIGEAREGMKALYLKIGAIKGKADESESIVREICRDIKDLDCAKKNLVASIAALKRVNMLATGVEQLRSARSKREAANLLEAISHILRHFEPYGDSVPRIIEVRVEVDEIKAGLEKELLVQFANDPCEAPSGFESVAEACKVVDALGARERFLRELCARQLMAYEQLFAKGSEFASLNDADRRFAWLRRLLRRHNWGEVFPSDWKVEASLVKAFAVRTRSMFLEVLQSGEPTDVSHTLKALQKSLVFEKEVKARYGNDSEDNDDDGKVDLASVFDPFMGPYVSLEKQNLLEVLKTKDESIDDEGALPVFSSSVHTFAYIKTSVRRCTALTTGQTFFKLYKAYAECLLEYSKKLTAQLIKLDDAAAAAAAPPWSSLETACYCLNTADYCAETIEQLAEIVKGKIEATYRADVDFEDEVDAFHDVVASSINRLVSLLDATLEPAMRLFAQVPWASLHSVEEESDYVKAISETLCGALPRARSLLSPLFFRNLCDKFVAHFLPKFYTQLISARRISDVASHQLLLDLHALKTLFLKLPVLPAAAARDDSQQQQQQQQPGGATPSAAAAAAATTPRKLPSATPAATPSATYTKYVTKQVAKIEMVLKLIGTPTEMLVERFKIMWPDGSRDDLLHVCALKGLRRPDQQHIVDTLYAARPPPLLIPPRGSSQGPTSGDRDDHEGPGTADARSLQRDPAAEQGGRSRSQEPIMANLASLAEQQGRALESKFESVSAHASLTINKVGSQVRGLINKSRESQSASAGLTHHPR